MPEERLLQLIRAEIAIQEIPKKKLARQCRISKPLFSNYIHGDIKMPKNVKKILIKELKLETAMKDRN